MSSNKNYGSAPSMMDEFTNAVRTCFDKYATFDGRASRAEYWYFFLFGVIVGIAMNILILITSAISSGLGSVVAIVCYIACLALVIPNIAAGVRRLHDVNKSGWAYLINLIPLVGVIIFIVWAVQPGNPNPNEYGNPAE